MLDTGAALSGDGSVAPAISNDAPITASGGLLKIAGAITGGGGLAISNGAELELGGATAQAVDFGGQAGTLKLDGPATFTGSISGLAKGDAIDLAGVQAINAVVNSSTLTGTAAGAATLTGTLDDIGAMPAAAPTVAVSADQASYTSPVFNSPPVELVVNVQPTALAH